MSNSRRRLDEHFMRMALSLAERGTGLVSPNPKVGCVLVKEGAVVGWGYHKYFGGPHAEIMALDMAGRDASGSTAYVSLEPCSHWGKTPPCAPRLVEAGVTEVVAAVIDPNPAVSGSGMKILEASGLRTSVGVLEEEAKWANRGFFRMTKLHRPWIVFKCAVSLDGMVALKNGKSRWITNLRSRSAAHLLRSESDAIVVGVNTVISDDPELSVRYVEGRNPLKVVLDGNLRTPVGAKVLDGGGCMIIAAEGCDSARARALEDAGGEVVVLPRDEKGHPKLSDVLNFLTSRGVCYLLIEGGPSIASSFVREGFVDSFEIFVAPKFLGDGLPVLGHLETAAMERAFEGEIREAKSLDGDLWLEVRPKCSPAL
ncbi:MAG TPA: bifunctional diaminohydroxyphosphoribosylaminopyrimidine deaminase/5-amino-6-(5-phosphoribosylamino)uracil reductase RibD [Thermosynergistes sp.]|nr:bifunctional diaminohydroxyphosphoribosylaminopyrimidine deaminase/5-amino-6-(5-phosphoribosylamino)uracil reductase RibD [Thermosynergistes sp.]